MMQRCYWKGSDKWSRYGGRGIKVCRRWHVFENFFADMGHRPRNKTLDRKRNDRNYCPSNCRWADAITQSRNRESTITLRRKIKHLEAKISKLETKLAERADTHAVSES